jgi:hypothetical protein
MVTGRGEQGQNNTNLSGGLQIRGKEGVLPFLGGVLGFELKGFTFARQVLYHLSHSST